MMMQAAAIAGLVLFTVFALGLCIFVHELGHLLVALWRGLHVERFSIGFGKKLWGVTRNGVEYVVSALPFGGYVALPQLDPTDEPQSSDGKPLPHAKPIDRVLTAAAGPLANIVFGFLLATVVTVVGVYRPAAAPYCEVFSVQETSPEYAAGLRPGQRIVAVNGKSFENGWADLTEMIVLSSGQVALTVEDQGETRVIRYKPDPNPAAENLAYPFFECRTPTVVHQVMPKSPAAHAGLQEGDEILQMAGEPVASASAFTRAVRESEGEPFALRLRRGDETLTLTDVRAAPIEVNGETDYRIGVVLDSPRKLAHPSPWEQFTRVISMTHRTLSLLFAPDSYVKPGHLSGPVGIVLQTGVKVYVGGLREGLAFIVFVCFSLALINLFPIPVLDGGHILFAFIEMITRRRIPTRVAYGLQTAFAVMLIAFMLYVTYRDVLRVGAFWKVFNGDETSETTSGESDATPDATESPAQPGTAGEAAPAAEPEAP